MRNFRRQQRPLAMASSGNLWTPSSHTPDWMKKLWLNCKPESVDERLWARVSEMVGYFNSSDMSPLKEDEDGALGVTLLPTPPNHASARIDCSLGTPLIGAQLLRPASPRPPPTPPNQVSSSTGGGGNEKPSPVKSVVCSPDFPVFQFFPGGEAGAVATAGATTAVAAGERGRVAPQVAPATPLPAESPASSTTTTAPAAKATFQCALCGKISASKTAHQNHLRVHAKEGDEFSQQRSAQNQQQNTAPSGGAGGQTQQQDPYPCTICGKTFAVPARLTRHFRTHTGEKPYQCEFCSKAFSVKENLSVHRRIHTKERPYKCEVCARAFEHSGKLHRHARIHTGERPHRCAVCGKTFIQSGQLVIHMRTHTGEKPYVCKSCGKGFTCSKQLKVHTRTHTGEKPYSCEICGKAFGYNHVLKLHQVAHFGEKVYKCTICHETFNSKKTMESHIKSHSGGGGAASGSSSSASSPHCPSQVPPTRTPSPPEAASPLSQTPAYSPPPQLPQSSRSPESFSGIQSQRHQPPQQPQQTHEQSHQQPLQQSHQQQHHQQHHQPHQNHQISSGDYEATSSSTSSTGSVAPSSSSDKENRNCPSVGSEDSEVSRRLSMMSTDGANESHDQQRTSVESYSNRQQPHDNQVPVHHVQTHPASPRQLPQAQHQSSSPPTSSYQPQQQEREVCYYVYHSGEGTSDGGIFQTMSSPSISYIQSQGPQSPVATQVAHHQHVGLSPMLLAAVGLSVEDEEEEDRKHLVAEGLAREEIGGRPSASTPVQDEAVLVVEDGRGLIEEEDDEEAAERRVHSPGQTVLTVTEPPIYLYPETLGQLQPGVGMVRVRAPPGTASSPEPGHHHHLHQHHPILRHYSPPYVLPSLPSGENYSSNALPPMTPVTPPGGKRRRAEPAPLLTPPSSNPVSPAPSAASSASSESEAAASAPLQPSAYPPSMREVLILPPRKRSKLILQSMEEMRGGGMQLLAPPNSETMQQARVSSVIHYAEKASPAV